MFSPCFQTAKKHSRRSWNTVKVRNLSTRFPVRRHPELVLAPYGGGKTSGLDWVEPVDFVNHCAQCSSPRQPFPSPAPSLPPNDLFISHSGGHLLHGDTSAMKGLLSSLWLALFFPLHGFYIQNSVGEGSRSLSAPCYDATRRRGLSAFGGLLAGPPPTGRRCWRKWILERKGKTFAVKTTSKLGFVQRACESGDKPQGCIYLENSALIFFFPWCTAPVN